MFRFETLEIWHESLRLVDDIYLLTRQFPKDELFGLTSQLRRAVVSVSANIAEGSASRTVKDFRNFLNIARKSLFETASLLQVAKNQKYISEKSRKELYNKIEVLTKRVLVFSKILKKL